MRSSLDYDQLPVHFVHAGGGAKNVFYTVFGCAARSDVV